MNDSLQLSQQAQELPLGVYRHYVRRTLYTVIGVAFSKGSEEEGELVIYRALAAPHELWARPLASFIEQVPDEAGVLVPRFEYVDTNPSV